MLRIKREEQIYSTTEFELQLDRELQLIQKHFPSSIVQLYAVPKVVKDAQGVSALEWLSPIGGSIKHYNTLDSDAKQALWKQMQSKQASVAALHDELKRQQRIEDALLLQPLLITPKPEQLYAINGEAIIVDWKSPPQNSAIPVVTPATPRPVPTTGFLIAKRKHWYLPLLLLLLLGLLALLFGWLYRAWPLGWFKSDTPKVAFEQNYACSAPNITKQPPEFTVILDTSHSMNLHIHTQPHDEAWFYEIGYLIDQSPRARLLFQKPSRFSIAKPALQNMVQQIHPDIPIRLISFNSCTNVIEHGSFENAQRQNLHSIINTIKANGPTPSALALEHAAKTMDGQNNDGMIVMFLDGEDGCGGNVCQVAQNIAAQQPRLRVNVIDISGNGLSNCVAEQTGGRVYASQDIDEISQLLSDSVEVISSNASCTN